jgi:hypothetical protein
MLKLYFSSFNSNQINMKHLIYIFMGILLVACKQTNHENNLVGQGQMPNIVRDKQGNIHLVYGDEEKIMYAVSTDGKTFSQPAIISSAPGLAASHMRGPQIAATSNGLLVTACTEEGNIFSFVLDSSGKWTKTARINDVDTVAKENLMALSADGQTAFAIWQDMRDGQNKIFGAKSTDGGRTWSKNTMIYASPDGSTCECCKPSVVMKGDKVEVMFRNWINGNRDMYVIESLDGGNSFGQAQKMGSGSWALNGCPMDGGNMVVNDAGTIETVWRRKSEIYSASKGNEEKKIGEGKNCTMESVNNKNVFAWTENGDVIVVKPQGMKKNLGEGSMPVLKALNNEHVICVWEDDKKIYSEIIEL